MEIVRKHQQKLSTVLLLVVIFLAGYVIGGINPSISEAQDTPQAIGDIDEAFAPLFETYQLIQSRYVAGDEIDTDLLIDGALAGMIDALGDPYSSYFNPEVYNSFTFACIIHSHSFSQYFGISYTIRFLPIH